MITLSVKEAIDALPALRSILDTELPAKAAYRLSRVAKALHTPLQTFEEARFKVFQKLGTEVEDKPGTYEIKDPEQIKLAEAEIEPLLTEEIKIDLDPLSVADFGEAQVKGGVLLSLEKVIV